MGHRKSINLVVIIGGIKPPEDETNQEADCHDEGKRYGIDLLRIYSGKCENRNYRYYYQSQECLA